MSAASYFSGLAMGLVCGAIAGAGYVATNHGLLPVAAKSAQPAALVRYESMPAQRTPPPPSQSTSAVVTAYCPCKKCCGASADGKTSRGRDAYATRGVAVDPGTIPYGSMVTIPGAGTFLADDTGGAMRQDAKRGIVHIDLRFNNHQDALNWGRQNLIINW